MRTVSLRNPRARASAVARSARSQRGRSWD